MLKYVDATGRIYLTDDSVGGSPTIFDTDDGLLNADPADWFSGSVTLPSLSASSSGASGSRSFIDRVAEYYIGTPSTPNANIALGQFRKSGATFYKSAHGSHILDMDAAGNTMIPQTDLVGQRYLTTVRQVTPMINNLGHLVFRERTVMRARDPGSPPSITLTLPAVTLEYNLFCGAWWGNAYLPPSPDARFGGASQYSTANPATGTLGIGYEYPGRTVMAAVISRGGGAVSSGTLSGSAVAVHDNQVSGGLRMTFASAAVASGTTSAASVTFASSPTESFLVPFVIRPAVVGSPTVSKTAVASGTSISLSITVGADKAAVVMVAALTGSITVTWTNAVSEPSASFVGSSLSLHAAVVAAGAGSVTVTATLSGSASNIVMMAAVFS